MIGEGSPSNRKEAKELKSSAWWLYAVFGSQGQRRPAKLAARCISSTSDALRALVRGRTALA